MIPIQNLSSIRPHLTLGYPSHGPVATTCYKPFPGHGSHCGATDHYSGHYSFCSHTVPTSTNELRPSTASPTSGQQLITGGHPTLRPATCHAFNRSICRHPNCTFPLRCELCGANHSAKYCPNRGSLS